MWLLGLLGSVLLALSRADEKSVNVGKLRSSADLAFTNGELDEALRLYSQVIHLEPRNELNYYKRFRVFHRQRKLLEALQDLSKALELKPDYKVCLAQRAKLLLALGRCEESIRDLQELSKLEEDHKDLGDLQRARTCADHIRTSAQAWQARNWAMAKESLTAALQIADASPTIHFDRGVANEFLREDYEAIADFGKVLKLQSDNLDALQKRGEAYFRIGEHAQALNHFKEALRMDPEHAGCKKAHKHLRKIMKNDDKARKAMQNGQYAEAVEKWRAAIAVEPGHSVYVAPTLIEISKACKAAKLLADALDAAQESVNVRETAEGVAQMGSVQLALEKWEDAVRSYRRAYELDDSKAYKEALRKAEVALEQSKKRNYYKDLGVSRSASQKEIKKAYRDAALRWHPDKVTEEDKENAEEEFAKIATAYEVLSDEELRRKYDAGEDPNEQNTGRQTFHRQQYHQFFQQGGGFQQGRGGGFHFRFG